MTSAKENQVGGDHYKSLKIQPIEYIHANGIGYMEGNVIKYVTRWRSKGGLADLEKARHYIDLLIQLEATEPKPEEQKYQYRPYWQDAPDWAQWSTVDSDGCAHWWEEKPWISESGLYWIADGRMQFYKTLRDFPGWKQTLTKRPEAKC